MLKKALDKDAEKIKSIKSKKLLALSETSEDAMKNNSSFERYISGNNKKNYSYDVLIKKMTCV